MSDITKDIVGVATAVIGLAMLTVVLRNTSNTAQVIGAGSTGFAQVLKAAMGG